MNIFSKFFFILSISLLVHNNALEARRRQVDNKKNDIFTGTPLEEKKIIRYLGVPLLIEDVEKNVSIFGVVKKEPKYKLHCVPKIFLGTLFVGTAASVGYYFNWFKK